MANRAGSNKIEDLSEVTSLQAQDQFLFFQNSTKKTKRVSRDNMLRSPGVLTTLDVPAVDTTPPAIPTGLSVTSATEKDGDGTEKVYIKASITANSESDLASYGWSIRRISGTPVFDGGGNLTGYGGTTQIFDAVTATVPASGGTKMQWDVRSNVWYEVKVCAIDKSGNASSYTSLTSSTVIQSAKDTTAPAAPTSVTATSAIKSVFLSWVNPTDVDLAYINIYRATSNTPPTIGTTTPYAKIMSNSYVDSNTTQGTTYYYWLTSVDFSGNQTSTTSTVVSIQPGLVANTDITTFAVDATKMFTNVVVLKADTWTDNSPSAGYIAWNAHTLVYGGASYSISAGNTNQQFVYWTGGTTYSTSNTNPTLTDGQFMIATNAKDGSGNPTGVHDLAWNAIANAVIGSAYIQNAAITNAKVNDMAVDKLTSGSISAQTISLIGDSVIKSSSATSATSGAGLWIKGLAGGGSEFAIGDLSGTNYGYLRWLTSTNSLEVKGSVKATEGWFGTSDTNGVKIDASGLELKGSGTTDNVGRIKAAIDWTNSPAQFTPNTAGIYLGKASNQYRFFVGNTGTDGLGAGNNFVYWDGSTLKVGGTIQATGGYFGSGSSVAAIDSSGVTLGTSGRIQSSGITYSSGFSGSGFYLGYVDSAYRFFIGNSSGNKMSWNGSNLSVTGQLVGVTSDGGDTEAGLIINSGFGIRYGDKTSVLTITGGDGNGVSNGAQIDFIGINYAGASNGAQGRLDISAGYSASASPAMDETATDGVIQFRTAREYASASVGAVRMRIEMDGTVRVVYTQTGTGAGDVPAGVPNSGAGKLVVETSVESPTYLSTSSKRFKKKIKNLKNGLEIVNSLRPVSFDWKNKDLKNDIGLIAEEVNQVIPSVIGFNNNGEVSSIDYSKLTPFLIQAVKELSLEVDKLKNKIK